MTTNPPPTSTGDIVSVVIPAFNQERYVFDAVQSALTQGPAVCEVIVVDDGSRDNTRSVLAQIQDPRLRVLGQSNQGPSAARNAGWRAAHSQWLQFLDADDALAPGAVARLLTAADDADHIPFGIESVYPDTIAGEPVMTAAMAWRDGNLLVDIACWYHGTLFTALLPSTALAAVGGFNEDVRCGEDFDLAVRLAQRHEFTFVPHITYRARMHAGNRHREFGRSAQNEYLEILRRNLGGAQGLDERKLYRKAMAHWLWRFGQQAVAQNDQRRALLLFWQSIRHQPWKLGAWKGLAGCLLHATRQRVAK